MSALIHHPFESDFRNFERAVNRLMDDFWRDSVATSQDTANNTGSKAIRRWAPRMDVHETDNEVIVSMELPGVPKDKVNIDVREQVLTVSGEHCEDKAYEKANKHVTERRYGSFSRSIGLPPNLKLDKASAKFENGVLTVNIEKGEVPGTRRITIS
ncbi:uncharacterized protein VTP21DRAFT_6614 [Calcarisporiella thermophila]|uniref:uncharacterized protein n=1 Tax=Calcarisporiella thermophila TaxID=911321 RepID=UPI0037434256